MAQQTINNYEQASSIRTKINDNFTELYTRPSIPGVDYWAPASLWIPRTTNGCGVDSREIGATHRLNFDELLFDATDLEYAQALWNLPPGYTTSGPLIARFYWTASQGTPGNGVCWNIQGQALSDGDDLETVGFGTAQVVTDTLIALNDMHIATTGNIVLGGTPTADTPVQFQIYRDPNHASDNLGFDARFLGVEISWSLS